MDVSFPKDTRRITGRAFNVANNELAYTGVDDLCQILTNVGQTLTSSDDETEGGSKEKVW